MFAATKRGESRREALKMYRSAILFFCLLVGIGSVVTANADTVAEARKAIKAIYKQRFTAIEHKNIDEYMASLTSDFVFVDQNGRVSSLTQVRDQNQAQHGSEDHRKAKPFHSTNHCEGKHRASCHCRTL